MSTSYNIFSDIEMTGFRNGNLLSVYKELPDLSIKDDKGRDLYHIAVKLYDYGAVCFLKEAGIKPGNDKYGKTALHHLAAQRGRDYASLYRQIYDCVQILMDIGVNPKRPDMDGGIAYYQAAINGMYPFIEALASRGVRMDATADEGKNLLHYICNTLYHRKEVQNEIENVSRIVKSILAAKSIDPEDKDIFGNTPLDYAQKSGVKEVSALFVPEDEAALKTGGMDIHHAMLLGDKEAVVSLLEAGANVNELSDKYGKTPLMILCTTNWHNMPKNSEYHIAMIDILLQYGVDLNYKSGNNQEHSALHYLLENGSMVMLEILDYLIGKGVDVNIPVNAALDTALIKVCRDDYGGTLNYAFIEKLVDSGADINKPNIEGQTPLMLYALHGDESRQYAAELLLDNNADVNYIDKYSDTALVYAAKNNKEASGRRIIEMMFDSRQEIRKSDIERAISAATGAGKDSIVKLLLEKL